MTAHHGYSSYTSNSARFASPGIQVAMLLALAARHMETARDCIKASDIEGRFNATEKCAVIISGLRGCLGRDTPAAAAMADTLDAYYSRMLSFLTQINVRNDLQLCEAVVESLRTMSSTWREVQARADAEARASLTTQASTTANTTDSSSGSSSGGSSSGGQISA